MKTVQDKDGNTIEVANDTPCHAGRNGALPIMLDATLDAALFTEMAEKEVAHVAAAPARKMAEVKTTRGPLLREADLQVNKHMDASHVRVSEWRRYRQALRDFPSIVDLDAIVWPTKPTTLP